MSLPGSGCCCGVIVGMVLAVLLAVAGTVAVYCWINPDARKSGVSTVEKSWNSFKDFGDDLIAKARKAPVPEIPKPEIKLSK